MLDAITRECPAVTEAILREAFEDTPTGKHQISIDELPPVEIIWDNGEEMEDMPTTKIVLNSMSDRVNLFPIR